MPTLKDVNTFYSRLLHLFEATEYGDGIDAFEALRNPEEARKYRIAKAINDAKRRRNTKHIETKEHTEKVRSNFYRPKTAKIGSTATAEEQRRNDNSVVTLSRGAALNTINDWMKGELPTLNGSWFCRNFYQKLNSGHNTDTNITYIFGTGSDRVSGIGYFNSKNTDFNVTADSTRVSFHFKIQHLRTRDWQGATDKTGMLTIRPTDIEIAVPLTPISKNAYYLKIKDSSSVANVATDIFISIGNLNAPEFYKAFDDIAYAISGMRSFTQKAGIACGAQFFHNYMELVNLVKYRFEEEGRRVPFISTPDMAVFLERTLEEPKYAQFASDPRKFFRLTPFIVNCFREKQQREYAAIQSARREQKVSRGFKRHPYA